MSLRSVSTHESLLIRLRDGEDSLAWSEFGDRYRELIFHYARRRGLQPADAEDATQDVLAAVLKSIAGFEYDPGRGRFRGWLKTIAGRAVTRKRRNTADALGHAFQSDGTLDAAEASGDDDPWEIEWRRYHARLATRKARFEFSSRDFEAFEAVTVEARAPADVARTFGMTTAALYQIKSRILRRIREHVAAQVAEEG